VPLDPAGEAVGAGLQRATNPDERPPMMLAKVERT
jgi:hypothetical protein